MIEYVCFTTLRTKIGRGNHRNPSLFPFQETILRWIRFRTFGPVEREIEFVAVSVRWIEKVSDCIIRLCMECMHVLEREGAR
jgi:hypothetical protein